MASTNVNTTSTRTVSLTANVTDSAGTGTKMATVSWTQNADEKVETAGSDDQHVIRRRRHPDVAHQREGDEILLLKIRRRIGGERYIRPGAQ